MSSQTNILLQSGTNELEIVEFELEYNKKIEKINQSFGINVAKVREIIRMPKLTKLPNLPEFVYGVFNLRGSVIPAFDLTKFLYGQANFHENRKMIISEFNKIKVGFIVREVKRIHRISWENITSPEAVQQWDKDKSTIVGIINMDGRQILMLDVEKIVSEIDPSSALQADFEIDELQSTPNILIAEDSSVINNMIKGKLQKSGMNVYSFRDGASAWNFIKEKGESLDDGESIKKHLDMVITDIEMPGMDGYSLTNNIKTDERFNSLPVLIFSSIVSEDILHKGESVGADAQLSKPDMELLVNKAIKLMNK